jgi:hypothetical protein
VVVGVSIVVVTSVVENDVMVIVAVLVDVTT